MRVITVLAEHEPLVRALAKAGCALSFAGPADAPVAQPGERYFYLGNMFEQIKTPLALRRIRRALARDRAPYVWWNRDAPWNCAIKPWRKLLVAAARRPDLHLAHSLQSAELFGHPVVYFPNAAQADHYHLAGRTLDSLREPAPYRLDVSFIGTISPTFRRVAARVAFLAGLGRRLQKERIAYRFFDTSVGSDLSVEQQIDIIQTSRINLNVGAVCDTPVPSWGIPERCFGVAACGGFLLCDERKHAADTFPAEAWASYADLEDCVARIKFFLQHYDRARDKAEKLHRNVMARHTYDVRAGELLRLVAQC
jgi:spore maturation protein CgeB